MPKTFAATLKENGLELRRKKTETLQVNVGLLCNLFCKHCHLECGPGRPEYMVRKTMDQVLDFAARNTFSTVDITGGAPEMVPDIVYLVENMTPLAEKVIFRSNLTLLGKQKYGHVLRCLLDHKVAIAASLPSVNQNQTNSQRGDGVWNQSIESLKYLNSLGYGQPESEHELLLVSNPTGAFLPVDQCSAEKKFRADLARKWGVAFSSLFTFGNVPLGRFKSWLEESGNYERYLAKLIGGFNPATVPGVMCTSLISVSWEGYLYDCDFNLAADLPFTSKYVHVSDVDLLEEGEPVTTGNHCFSCTAGAGFT